MVGGRVLPRLHVVTDDAVLSAASFPAAAEAVLRAGGTDVALHLRGHGTAGGVLFALAETLVPVAARAGALLLVNDRVDVALAAGLRGVQLGRRSLRIAESRRLLGDDVLIGYSAHALPEALEAIGEGSDFLLLGAIWETASHPARAAAGPALVAEAAWRGAVPVLGIGGVTPSRAAELVAAGAHGVAAVSGVWQAADPAAAVRGYLETMRSTADSSSDLGCRGLP